MGILDQAIREHLDLKRRRGATDSELQRLEDEAFGPPSRPGEPDFPEHDGEPAEQSGNGVAREGAVAEASAATEAPIPPPSEGEQGEAEPPVEAAEEEETAVYEQTGDAELERGDLDPEVGEEGQPPDEPPIETLDTVEHALPEEEVAPEAPPSEEPGPEPPGELEPSEEEPGPTSEDESSAEGEPQEEEEDVLADTPDFLKDAPEDDELWFEQGKPKDFDF